MDFFKATMFLTCSTRPPPPPLLLTDGPAASPALFDFVGLARLAIRCSKCSTMALTVSRRTSTVTQLAWGRERAEMAAVLSSLLVLVTTPLWEIGLFGASRDDAVSCSPFPV